MRAVADLQEARLDYTVGSCSLGVNKDCVRKGVTVMPVDTDVPVLRVLDPEGDVRAVVFSYAAHPTTMGGQQIGPDFPGPARDFIAGKIEGCLPIFLQGCGGDAKPRNLTAAGQFGDGPVEVVCEIGHVWRDRQCDSVAERCVQNQRRREVPATR